MSRGLSWAAVGLALAATGGANALAADPGVIATAPSGTGAPTVSATPANSAPSHDATDSQIAGWIATDRASAQPGGDTPAPRTVHGEIDAGVGTGGYRNVSGVADIPVGQNSDLIVAASSTSGQVRGGQYGGYAVGGEALALGVSANGAPASAAGCGRQPWGQAWAPTSLNDCIGPSQP
jgi:hypothetical protein